MDDIIDNYIDMTHYTKYFKLYKYIIELDVQIYHNDDNYDNDNEPKRFVKKIFDFVNNLEVEEICYHDKIITKNNYIKITSEILFDTYKEAFDHNFMTNKDWTIFPFGYSGTYKSYVYKSDGNYNYNKYVDEEYYHINGQKEGIYKKYNKNNLMQEFNYVNGKLHGNCYYYNAMFINQKYFNKGIIIVYRDIKFDNFNEKIKLNYNMGKLHGIQQLIHNDIVEDELYYYKNYNIHWFMFKILDLFGFI